MTPAGSTPASATALRWRTKSRVEPFGSRRAQAAASSARRESAEQPLGDLGLRGEESLTAQPDRLDQAAHEDVGAPLLQHRRGGPVELEEGLDPLPRLGRDLRALQRRLASRRPGRACGGERSSSAAPGRPSAARPAAGSAPAPRPPSRRDRPAPATRRSRRAPRVAGRAPPGPRGGTESHALPSPPPPARPAPGRRPARRSLPARCPRRSGARPRARRPAPAPAHWCSARTRHRVAELRSARRARRVQGVSDWARRPFRPRLRERTSSGEKPSAQSDTPALAALVQGVELVRVAPRPAPRGSPAELESCPRARRPSRARSGGRSRRGRRGARRGACSASGRRRRGRGCRCRRGCGRGRRSARPARDRAGRSPP